MYKSLLLPCLVGMVFAQQEQITDSNPYGGCGWRNPDGIGSLHTDDEIGRSKFGEFPWMVVIYEIIPVDNAYPYGKTSNMYTGGGSLIHPAVVLTTAHRIETHKTLKVRAGVWNACVTNQIYPHQDRDIHSTIIHDNFNPLANNLFYDIALLFLTSPMDTSMPHVNVVCLPPPQQHMAIGKWCIASGWGKNKFGMEGSYQAKLKKVTVPVVDREQCQMQLRKTLLGPFFKLHSSFMCAGGEAGIDTCTGDGGSPLMCPIENHLNRYMLSGMVAWGAGCGEEDIPGVYVDVSNLRDWVDDKIISKGLNPMVYTF